MLKPKKMPIEENTNFFLQKQSQKKRNFLFEQKMIKEQ